MKRLSFPFFLFLEKHFATSEVLSTSSTVKTFLTSHEKHHLKTEKDAKHHDYLKQYRKPFYQFPITGERSFQ